MTIVASYRRTPQGRLLGNLSTLPAPKIGAFAISAALAAAGIHPSEIDVVVGGQVLQAGQGQNPARQAAVLAGIPLDTPAFTINSVCLSGMEAVVQGHRMIALGEAQIVAVVGQESMSLAPHLLPASRVGKKYGPMGMIDSLDYDGLSDSSTSQSMGQLTDEGNTVREISREAQDSWSVTSHLRAAQSAEFLAGEITPVMVTIGRNEILVETDEGIRADATVESFAALRPVFRPDGSITAGNASPISDGASSIILMSDKEALRRGGLGIARIVSHGFVAGPDTGLHSQPSRAIERAMQRAHAIIGDRNCQLFEINEAFASVVLQSISDLGISPELVNSHGGAIALGHPLGSSGTRIVGTLARSLHEKGHESVGAAGICGGGGQGLSVILTGI